MPTEINGMLFKEQMPRLKCYAISLTGDADTADDLVQDCLERGISRYGQFQPGTDLRSWLFTIMHNIFCDNFRRRQRQGVSVSIDRYGKDLPQPAPQTQSLQLIEVSNGFADLSRNQRRLVMMVAVEGKSHAETAAHFGVAVGTIKSRLSRARAKLRDRQRLVRRGSRRSLPKAT